MDIYQDFSWHVPPPDSLARKDRVVYYRTSLNWHNVMPQTIARWRRFGPSRSAVLKKTGKSVDDHTNEELAKFIITHEKGKRGIAKPSKIRAATKSREKRVGTIDELMDEYLKHYSATTPNDLDSLRQLCSLKLTLDDLEKAEQSLMRSVTDPDKHGIVTETYINSIVNAKMKYLTEYRALQQMLGIDRQTRDKSESETGGVDYIKQLVQSGAGLLKSKAVVIRCDSCKSVGSIINLGFILAHFGNWEFRAKCVKCGSDIYLNSPADLKESIAPANA